MRNLGCAAAAALCLALTGCGAASVRIGVDFDAQTMVRQIKVGQTNQAQVRRWLGIPQGSGGSLEVTGEELEEWTYFYGRGQLPDMSNPTVKTLQIKFGKDGLVRGYNWSDSERSRP